MQGSVSKSILVSIVSLAFAVSIASAKFPGHGQSGQKRASVEIPQTAQIPNGPTLQPGTYKLELLGDSASSQVGFYQNGKLVGQAVAQVVDQNEKSSTTEVHIDGSTGSAVLTEIDVSGWTKKIEFGQAAGAGGSGQSGQ